MVHHFYTTDTAELASAVRNGATFEGVSCYVFNSQTSNTKPVQRLRKEDHFYTIDAEEALNAIAKFGYIEEGVAFFAFPTQQGNTTPFFRRRDITTSAPAAGEHFYTADATEAQKVLNEGYVDEGICCFVYVPGTAASNTVPLYRLIVH